MRAKEGNWLAGEEALVYAERMCVDVLLADTMFAAPARVRKRLGELGPSEGQYLLNQVAVRISSTGASAA